MSTVWRKTVSRLTVVLFCSLLGTSCATSVGMTAAAVTSATIAVGATVVKAPFKLIGMAMDDDNDDEEAEAEN